MSTSSSSLKPAVSSSLRRSLVALAWPALAIGVAGCAVPPVAAPARRREPSAPVAGSSPGASGTFSGLLPLPAGTRYLLLGEVHDNGDGHALRLDLLRSLLTTGRWAIAFEQFDAVAQPRLDAAWSAALARFTDDRAAAAHQLAEAGGFSFEGWHWDFYRPVVELLLAQRLPLVAANLSRTEIRSAMAAGTVAQTPRPAGWLPAAEAMLVQAISDGHCGLLPESAVSAMSGAQVARDRTLARSMVAAHRRTGLPVLLLAGNGHVRTDIGVARHLAEQDPGAGVLSVGFLESSAAGGQVPAASAVRFDHSLGVTPVERPDPCEALRKRMSGGRAAS